MSYQIAIIVPAYNEADTLEYSFKNLATALSFEDTSVVFLIINDGSKDMTGDVIKKIALAHSNVQILNLDSNLGKGAAIYKGIEILLPDYEFIGFIDADLDLNPTYFRSMVINTLQKNIAVSIGSKRHPLSVISYPKYRKALSWIYKSLVYLITEIKATDTQTGMKIFRQDVLMEIFPYLQLQSFAFDVEILALCNSAGFRFTEHPIELQFGNSSSLNLRSSFSSLIDLFKVRKSLSKYRSRRDNLPSNDGI